MLYEVITHAWDVLKGTAVTGNRVIISGSNQTGIWTALELAAIGTPTPEQLKFLMVSGAETPDRLAALITDGIKEITITRITSYNVCYTKLLRGYKKRKPLQSTRLPRRSSGPGRGWSNAPAIYGD